MRLISYAKAINEATSQAMKSDKNVIIIGLGVTDPNGIFGTTSGLLKKFGNKRVYDMPISENAITGIVIGCSMNGLKPILTHQRVEFALLSLEQIINQAAKLHFMTAGKVNVPIVIRMIVGRGWGNGAQHTQSLESIFGHIPGLKVVMPSNAYDAKGLLISSIKDKNPVIFIEHRWLHNTISHVPKRKYFTKIGKAKKIKIGGDLTIVAHSYAVILAIKCSEILEKYNIRCEVIDLISIKPLDKLTIINSVKKTKKLLVIDNGWTDYGVSAEIIALVSEKIFSKLKASPQRIGVKNMPIPSSALLADFVYPNIKQIIIKIEKILNKKFKYFNRHIIKVKHKDIPNKNFTGPF